jgi:hypothetical protein
MFQRRTRVGCRVRGIGGRRVEARYQLEARAHCQGSGEVDSGCKQDIKSCRARTREATASRLCAATATFVFPSTLALLLFQTLPSPSSDASVSASSSQVSVQLYYQVATFSFRL